MLTHQNEGQTKWDTNQAILYLMHQCHIGKKPDAAPTSNLNKFMLKCIIKFEQLNKRDRDKHNPHTKIPLLSRHNQNSNITTVQMLMVLLQLLHGEVWEGEFSYLWQQRICHKLCHCLCSSVYIYIMAANSWGDCSLWLRICDNPVHMSHVTFLITLYTCLMSHFW